MKALRNFFVGTITLLVLVSFTRAFGADPDISSQPTSQSVSAGGTAVFNVTATGTSPFAYQWYFNTTTALANATNASLTITGAQAANAGNYTVVVTNSVGTITSAVAVLTVQPVSAVFFNFNTPGQFTNNFLNSQVNPVGWTMVEAANTGVGGSGSVDYANTAAGNDSTSVFVNQAYDFSYDGAKLVASMMVKLKAPTANNRILQLGFLNRPTTLTGERLTAFMSARVSTTAQPATTVNAEQQTKLRVGTGTSQTTITSANTNLVAGNWYRLTLIFENIKATTANSYRVSGIIEDMGATGLTSTNVIPLITSTVANADIVNASSVVAGFRGFDTAGADVYDNLYINRNTNPPVNVVFTASPTNRTVLQGRPTTFYAAIDGVPPYAYQWNSNGVPIPGATDWQYTIRAVTTNMNNTAYTLSVVNGSGTTTSSAAVLTVTPDTVGPVALSAGSFDGNTIGVRFNEKVDPASASTPGNYNVPGSSVFDAVLRPDGQSVVLYLNTPLSGGFTVQVSGVKDLFSNTMTITTLSGTVQAQLTSLDINVPLPTGTIYTSKDGDFEISGGGSDVWNTADQFRFTYQTITGDFDVKALITDETVAYGSGGNSSKVGLHARETLDPTSAAVDAYVIPPFPGLNRYECGLRSINTGGTGGWGVDSAGDPVNQGNIGATHPNSWVRLRRVGNTFTCYSSSDGTNWRLLGITIQPFRSTLLVGMMFNSHAQGYVATSKILNYGGFTGYPGATLTWTTDMTPTAPTVAAGGTTTLNVLASVSGAPSSEIVYAWQRSDGAGGWTNLPAGYLTSTVNTFTLTTVALFKPDDGAQFRCIAKVTGGSITSSVATVTVTDAAAPTLTSAFIPIVPSLGTFQIMLVFSEPVSLATATNRGNYSVTNAAGLSMGVANVAFLGSDPRVVMITTSNLLVGGNYGVVINNVQDLAGNTIAANTVRTFTQLATLPATSIVQEWYAGVTTTGNLTDLVNNAKFLGNTPDWFTYGTNFGINSGIAAGFPSTLDQYGVRMYTYFMPTNTGVYKFYLKADDFAEFIMNTNALNSTLGMDTVTAVSSNRLNSPATQQAYSALDNNVNTKYLNFDKTNTGFIVTPVMGSSTVTGVRFTTAGDAPERDPMTFTLEGTTGDPSTGPWTVITSGNTGLTTTRLSQAPAVLFANATAYTSYRVVFPTIRDVTTANSMQVAEVELLDSAGVDVTGRGAVVQVTMTGANGSYTAANSVTNNLNAGQLYYMQIRFKESTGGDGVTAAIRVGTDTGVPGQNEAIPASLCVFPADKAPATPVVTELYKGALGLTVGSGSIGGSTLADLATAMSTFNYVAGLPDLVGYEKNFGYSANLGNTSQDNYLGRLYSYFVAPSNGLYQFWMRSDDASQLLMNTNAVNSTDPAGIALLGALGGYTASYTLIAQNVPLTGGQQYYMEGRWKEGSGGDGMTVAVRAQSDASTPPDTEVIPASMFAFPTPVARLGAIGLVGITPASPTVIQGRTVTFAPVGLSGALPYSLIWLKNGIPVLLSSAPYTTLPLTLSDNGAVITLLATNAFSTVTRSTTITVIADTNAPTILNVSGTPYLTTVNITYSQPVSPGTAQDAGNYQIAGLSILGSSLDPTGTRVALVTSPQTPGTTYTVIVNGVRDASAGNPIAPNTTKQFTAWLAGGHGVYAEMYTNIPNTDVATLQNTPNFIYDSPDAYALVPTFFFNSQVLYPGGDLGNFGTRMAAYFVPPSNGVYRFYIRSDDLSALYMNTNGPDPAGKVLIAQLNVACCKSYSDASGGQNNSTLLVGGIRLTGGNLYYTEMLGKQGGGGQSFQMAFRESADASTPPDAEVASGAFFIPWGNPDTTTLNLTQIPPATTNLSGTSPVTLSVAASVSPASLLLSYQWQKFSGSTFTNIPDATGTSYSLTSLPCAEPSAQIRVVVSAPGRTVISPVTTVIVVIPSITLQPLDVTVALDVNASFTAAASGTLPLFYQWYHGSTPVPGGTSNSITIPTARVPNAGNYTLVVTNCAGSVTSRVAVLTVIVISDFGVATRQNHAVSIPVVKLVPTTSLTFTSAGPTSTNGGTVTVGGGNVTYTPPLNYVGNDRFDFVVTDSHGDQTTARVYVLVILGDLPSQNQLLLVNTGHGILVRFAGIPGFNYDIQRTTDVVTHPILWQTLTNVTAPIYGIIEFLDTNPPPGSGFYRTSVP